MRAAPIISVRGVNLEGTRAWFSVDDVCFVSIEACGEWPEYIGEVGGSALLCHGSARDATSDVKSNCNRDDTGCGDRKGIRR